LNYMRDRIDRGFNVNNASSPNPDYSSTAGDSYDIEPIYTELDALFDNTTATAPEAARVARKIVDKLNTLLCAGQLTAASQTIVVNFLTSGIQTRNMHAGTGKTAADRKPALIATILMIMGSPDYLIQK